MLNERLTSWTILFGCYLYQECKVEPEEILCTIIGLLDIAVIIWVGMDSVLRHKLLLMYLKCGGLRLGSARRMFAELPQVNDVRLRLFGLLWVAAMLRRVIYVLSSSWPLSRLCLVKTRQSECVIEGIICTYIYKNKVFGKAFIVHPKLTSRKKRWWYTFKQAMSSYSFWYKSMSSYSSFLDSHFKSMLKLINWSFTPGLMTRLVRVRARRVAGRSMFRTE